MRESYLREQNVKSDFPMLPDGVNGGGHVVGGGALWALGQHFPQNMAAPGAALSFITRVCTQKRLIPEHCLFTTNRIIVHLCEAVMGS